jgi:RNA polymerase primary sigma factor
MYIQDNVTSKPQRRKRTRRLTFEDERQLALDIMAAESRTEAALMGVTIAQEIIQAVPKKLEKTRAGYVNRLERAVEAAQKHGLPRQRGRIREASEAWAAAESLRWKLAMSGRRIAIGEARKMTSPFLDLEDLVQEGIIGLLRAAKRFDPEREIRFSTYARWWVRAQMTRAIDHTGRPIRLPGCAVEQRRNLRKAKVAFEVAGETYSISDLAAEAGIETERATRLLAHGIMVSLEQPVDVGRKPRPIGHFLVDEEAVKPDHSSIRGQQRIRMHEAFSDVLSTREQIVLTRRYGLDDGGYKTLAQIGTELGLSRERIRQIERIALIRLRGNDRLMDPVYEQAS